MLSDIANYVPINEHVATGGQPTEAQITELAKHGFQIVINLGLNDPRYSLADEAGSVQALGMTYHHIPITFNAPLPNQLRDFVALMDSAVDQRIFIHCALNYRSSCFTALYGQVRWRWSEWHADEFIHGIWRPDAIWSTFIERARAALQMSSGGVSATPRQRPQPTAATPQPAAPLTQLQRPRPQPPRSAPPPAPPPKQPIAAAEPAPTAAPTAPPDTVKRPAVSGHAAPPSHVIRQKIERYYDTIWNRRDQRLIPVLLTTDLPFRTTLGRSGRGRRQLAAEIERLQQALQGCRCEIKALVCEGEQGFVQLQYRGLHHAELLGFPATQQPLAWSSAALFQFRQGRIVQLWELGDLHDLYQQLSRHC